MLRFFMGLHLICQSLVCVISLAANVVSGVCLGLVWKLKSPSGLKGIGEEISSFPAQSRRGFEVPKVALNAYQLSPSCLYEHWNVIYDKAYFPLRIRFAHCSHTNPFSQV
jgi:hypothetical protein